MADLPYLSETGYRHSYKAEWAKNLVLENIKEFWLSRPDDDPAWEHIIDEKRPSKEEIEDNKLPMLPATGREDEDTSPYKICIIGAGVAGLFTAMIIDQLNERFNLGFKYEILEAAEETRFGGRLYTHRFTENLHDYYDIGAMRFPEISIMERTFDLFQKELKFVKNKEPKQLDGSAKNSLPEEVKLIPYYLTGLNCPQYYNDLHYPSPPKDKTDPFQLQSHRDDERIPEKWLRLGSDGPGRALNEAIQEIKAKLREDAEKGESNGPGWKALMKVDTMSVRQFLSQCSSDYNYRTVEWMETFGSGTLNFDESISELIIGSLDFDYWSGVPAKNVDWWCIEGGTDQVATKMRKKLKGGDVQFKHRVTMIRRDYTIQGHNDVEIRVGPAKVNDAEEDRRCYAAVFSTATLGSLQRMDLTDAFLNYGTKLAIRALRYGTSCKVGIKFKRAWWIEKYGIIEGGVGYTDLPLRVCVYPSYNIKDDKNKDAVLLVSYTWGQDASRFAALISKQKKYEVRTPETPDPEEELKNLLIQNLALLHCPQKNGLRDEIAYQELYKEINDAYLEHHAYDWGADPFMSGAFAHFGPGQFSKIYPNLITPSAGGKLFIIGEAASKHHAWIVGALESAVRGVYQLLMRYQGAKRLEAEEAIKWLQNKDNSPYGPVPTEEEDRTLVNHQVYIADVRERAKRGSTRVEGHNM